MNRRANIADQWNGDAEAGLLGAILVENAALAKINGLTPEDFFDPHHRVVFEAMRELEAAHKPIDPQTLGEILAREGKITAIGGLSFLSELAGKEFNSDNAAYYAGTVHELGLARRIRVRAGEIAASGAEVIDLLAKAHDFTDWVGRIPIPGAPIAEVAAADAILRSPAFSAPQRTYSTGFAYLDRLIAGGFKARQMSCYAAPPGSGKTYLLCEFARHLEYEIPVLYVSTEIDEGEIAARLAAQEMRGSLDDICALRTNPEHAASAVDGRRLFVLFLDNEPDPIGAIRRHAIAIREQCGQAPAILVDYIQGLADEGSDNVRTQVTAAAQALRRLSQELDVPVLAVSTTSRAYYGAAAKGSEDDPLYYLAAGKESGGVESSAAVFFYLDMGREVDGEGCRRVRLCVAKARRGEPGFSFLRFHGPTGTFEAATPAEHILGLREGEARLERAILQALQVAQEPPILEELAKLVHTRKQVVGAAVTRLIAAGKVVEEPGHRLDKRGKTIGRPRAVTVLLPVHVPLDRNAQERVACRDTGTALRTRSPSYRDGNGNAYQGPSGTEARERVPGDDDE